MTKLQRMALAAVAALGLLATPAAQTPRDPRLPELERRVGEALAPLPQARAAQRVLLRSASINDTSQEVTLDFNREIIAGLDRPSVEAVFHDVREAVTDQAISWNWSRLRHRVLIEGVSFAGISDSDQLRLLARQPKMAESPNVPRPDWTWPHAGPLAGRKIMVSPGHGWIADGEQWKLQRPDVNGLREDFLNAEMVAPLRALLEESGGAVLSTRELDKAAGTGPTGHPRWQEAAKYHIQSRGVPSSVWNLGAIDYEKDINSRPRYADFADADILVSLHNNASNSARAGEGSGTRTLYDTSNPFSGESEQLATSVHRAVIAAIRSKYDPNWRDQPIDIQGTAGTYGENHWAGRPAIIVEVAFMDRPSPDNAALRETRFHQVVAEGIRDGVRAYFGVAQGPPGALTASAAGRCTGGRREVAIEWTPSADATSYDVLRNGAVVARSLTSREYVDTAVTAGGSYAYAVVAKNQGGSTRSNDVSVTAPDQCTAPGSFSLTLTPDCGGGRPLIRLSWSRAAGAASYDVYRDGAAVLRDLAGTEFVDAALAAGRSYVYVIRAKNGLGQNSSNQTSATAPASCGAPAAPILTAVPECAGSSPQIRLSWTPAAGALTYDVYRNGSLYASSIAGTQFLNTLVTANVSYTYVVRAKNGSGSTPSSSVNATASGTCGVPGSFTVTSASECSGGAPQIRIAWTPASGATTYEVIRGGVSYATGITTTQFLNTVVTPGTSYTYVVRARNSAGTRDSNATSATASASCGLPSTPVLSVTAECAGASPQNRLTWTASLNAATYDVYRNGFLYASGNTGTQFLNTIVTPGTSYTYFVRARNSSGTADSNSVSVTANTSCGLPSTPVLSVTAECAGANAQNRLTWTASLNATAYDVYRNGSLYISGVAGTQFLNTLVTPGATYSYAIRARNNAGTSASNTVSVSTRRCP